MRTNAASASMWCSEATEVIKSSDSGSNELARKSAMR